MSLLKSIADFLIFKRPQTIFVFIVCSSFLFSPNVPAQSESPNVPKDWQTFAEQTD